jgi:hypothetical protein
MSAEGGRGAVHEAGTRVSYNREPHTRNDMQLESTCEERHASVVAHGLLETRLGEEGGGRHTEGKAESVTSDVRRATS